VQDDGQEDDHLQVGVRRAAGGAQRDAVRGRVHDKADRRRYLVATLTILHDRA